MNHTAHTNPLAGERKWSLRRLLREELGALEVGRMLAHVVCAALPECALGRTRTRLLRTCGVRLGSGTLVNGTLRLHGPRGALSRLTVGEKCFFTTPLFLDLTGEIVIGGLVTIGNHVRLITSSHDIGPEWCRCWSLRPQRIVIEDGCWIGAGATIMPGVTLGAGSVVAAGALVRHDVPAGALVAGIPARVIRMLDRDGALRTSSSG